MQGNYEGDRGRRGTEGGVERSREYGEEKCAGYVGLGGASSRLYCVKQCNCPRMSAKCVYLYRRKAANCAGIRYLGGVMKFKSTEHKERDC